MVFVQLPRAELIADDDRRHEGDRLQVPREQPEHRHIVHLGDDGGAEAVAFTQHIEPLAHLRVTARQEQRPPREIVGPAEGTPAPRVSDEGDRLPRETDTAPGVVAILVDAAIGEDQIELMGAQAGEEFLERRGLQDERDPLAVKQRGEEAALEVPRHVRHRTDADHLTCRGAPRLEGGDELVPRPDDGLGVLEGDPSRLGEDELASLAVEERLPDAGLQLPDLRGERGLREPEMLGGARELALARDGPEVQQMMVVEWGRPVRHRSVLVMDLENIMYFTEA